MVMGARCDSGKSMLKPAKRSAVSASQGGAVSYAKVTRTDGGDATWSKLRLGYGDAAAGEHVESVLREPLEPRRELFELRHFKGGVEVVPRPQRVLHVGPHHQPVSAGDDLVGTLVVLGVAGKLIARDPHLEDHAVVAFEARRSLVARIAHRGRC